MKEEDLLKNYPRLYHMAEDASWDSVVKHGLLSTIELLDHYEFDGEERRKLESERRPESVRISREGLPSAVVRDQKPMTRSALEKCLTDGTTPEEWFETLNARVFFWLSKDRLQGLLGARAYRDKPQTVITLDTASLVGAHRDVITLSPINSGATIYNPVPRGRSTFMSIADFPFEERRKTMKKLIKDAVVELTVMGGVPEIEKHALAAHRVFKGAKTELWRREGSDPSEGP
ncbi:hypothetical protein [Bradyrhizobium sp. 191]|uniref:DUF7002 family protein n=1 Tax=Bradyrhizobium sp. 191 TaxID=2782659 RepID=UPI0020002869|nr:hypothetical protein [Bradyrhizobium sp. 191]UPJ68533.1 hypothetical protein IVB23_15485 [Bradyrhizobium sp. 191]